MDLATLRALVLENAGSRVHVGAPQIDRVVNRAVEHVVNLVEQTAKFYNLAATPKSVTASSGTEVYYLNAASAAGPPTFAIRKILFAERTDVTWNGRPITCEIVDFRERNAYGSSTFWLDGFSGPIRPIIYFVRNSAGVWHLGFVNNPTASMTLDVYYAPQITELADDTDVPYEVPEHHHELVAVRATKTLMDQFALDSRAWDRNYLELRQMLQQDLDSYDRTGPWSRRVTA